MRIWTGRAGSGKTTAILREIAALSEKGEGRQILLVPELNSHLMERRLAAATHNHGARTAEVLTFSRLADRVFSEVGGLAQQMLTPAGQLLTLQEAARRVQGGLSAWKGLADKPELLQEALRLIDECKTCAVAPETLFAAAEESEDAVLAEKLSDLAQILTAYERLCEESLPDPRDRLTHLRDRLAESHTLDGAAVYLDGFLGFTVQESVVVDAMLAAGVPLSAAVTCDTDYPEIFLTGCKTVQKLTRMAKHHNQTVERIELGESKVARPAGLRSSAKACCRCVPHRRVRTASGCTRRLRRLTSASTRRLTFGARCGTKARAAAILWLRHAISSRTARFLQWRWRGMTFRCSSRKSRICCLVRRWRWSQMHSRRYEITSDMKICSPVSRPDLRAWIGTKLIN